MKLDSKYFDKIRVKPSEEQRARARDVPCDWPGCSRPARHRAPKGRGTEGQYWNYCMEHVQQYNKSYNFFAGMSDNEVQGFQKDAQTGHRPTWKLGENAKSKTGGERRFARSRFADPHALLGEDGEPAARRRPARALRSTEVKALHTLGLDETATPDRVKSQYKTLVKRLHPDANGGSRANEETLKAVIHAYDHLRSTGFC